MSKIINNGDMRKVMIFILIITGFAVYYAGRANNKTKSSTQINTSIISAKWIGTYTLDINYGKLDEFSDIFVGYTVIIEKDSAIFFGAGYQTYFEYKCAIIESDILQLVYIRTIEGITYYGNVGDIIATITFENSEYNISSPNIYDQEGNNNVKFPLIPENDTNVVPLISIGKYRSVNEDGEIEDSDCEIEIEEDSKYTISVRSVQKKNGTYKVLKTGGIYVMKTDILFCGIYHFCSKSVTRAIYDPDCKSAQAGWYNFRA